MNQVIWRDSFWTPAAEFLGTLDRLFDAEPREVAVEPACDLQETATHYLISVDLPGIKRENIHIETAGDRLVVTGERKAEVKDGARHVQERSYGKFARTFTLGRAVPSEKIEATYQDGVLHIAVPKAEATKARQIEVKTEDREGFLARLQAGANADDKKVN